MSEIVKKILKFLHGLRRSQCVCSRCVGVDQRPSSNGRTEEPSVVCPFVFEEVKSAEDILNELDMKLAEISSRRD